MMVDLSPASRLTRKRNMLLQKQLGVQLQILTDEYRMTKKDLEKNSRDLGVFLMCLRDRAPGLSSYGQPDTRAMNAKNILHDRQAGNIPKKDDRDELIAQVIKKTKDHKKESKMLQSGTENRGQENNESDKSKSALNRGNKNVFFNKRIVLDSQRRSFLQHSMNTTESACSTHQDPRRLGGATSHAGFLSNRDSAGEASTKQQRPHTVAPHSHRSKTPRYGSDAYSEREENIRQHVLGRFDVIFDPQNVKREGSIKRTATSSTPLFVPSSSTIPEEQSDPVLASRPPPGGSGSLPPTGYVLNRRVAWSAPPKRREAPIAPGGASDGSAAAATAPRHNLSVTPRSGTGNMAALMNRRSSSATCARTTLPSHDGRTGEVNTTANAVVQNVQPGPREPHRPRTAPPVYQLMQKSVSAPRQQVAGILAEIQSRRADTRAILLKSKQLKKLVKGLAPEEAEEDSFSD